MFSCICNLPIGNDTLYKAFTLGLRSSLLLLLLQLLLLAVKTGFEFGKTNK